MDRMKTILSRWCLAVLCGCLALPAAAAVHEEQLDLPVQVSDIYGKQVAQSIRVTVWSDDANPRPAPVLVLNHGRAPEAQVRAGMGRVRYSEASRFFVRRGFIVVVPTRVGYGISGGPDVEDSGICSHRNYPPVYGAAADQALAALAAARQRPDAAADRAVMVGQSFGGAAVLAVAARNPPGVQAVVNFAGGGGGDPKTRPQRPCATAQMERLLGSYGETARVPSLWIYAENDQFFGVAYPREWFTAYRDAGGTGDFVQVPPIGSDGHLYFSRFAASWQPRISEFLDAQGFPAPAAPSSREH